MEADLVQRARATALALGRSVLDSYSEILFLQRPWPGLLVLAATFAVPSIGLTGLASTLAAYGYARFIGIKRDFLASGFFTYNALLVGLGIGSLFEVTPLSLLLAGLAGIMSINLSLILNRLFGQTFRLPVLSLPFVIISMIAYLASLGYSGLLVHAPPAWVAAWQPEWLPEALGGLLRSLGAIFFLPYPAIGLVLLLLLFAYSRILFLLAVGGYLLGAWLSGLMGGLPGGDHLDPNNFNFILIAMALGGVFLVPSRKSLAMAAVAVLLAIPLLDATEFFWSLYGLPAFTLPFNLVTLGLLYVLTLVGFPEVADRIGESPEKTLDDHLARRARFPSEPRRLLLPFSGDWTVWQGFSGPWTHQGNQSHALDFVIEQQGSTHLREGLELKDYHAWNKPVLSPIRGRVAMLHDGVRDNRPGEVNEGENWGNWVAIDSGLGWHVVVAHLAEGSLQVEPGQWVEPGTRLGACGNSGYSPQPHLHLHVQIGPVPGEPTLPFLVQCYREDGDRFVPDGVPATGAQVTPLLASERLQLITSLVLDSRWRFELSDDRRQTITTREVVVGMDALGATYLDSGRARLYFHREFHQFYFYRLEGRDPLLATLFKGLPRLPLVHQTGLKWQDTLPLSVAPHPWLQDVKNLARVLFPHHWSDSYAAQFSGRREVRGQLCSGRHCETLEVTLASGPGLVEEIRLPGRTLRIEPLAERVGE